MLEPCLLQPCFHVAGKDVAAEDGATALYMASQNGHSQVARLLCQAGANKDRATWEGSSPLDAALGCEHAGVVEILRGCGVPYDALPLPAYGQSPY